MTGFEQCILVPAIPNALLIFLFILITIPGGYFYARHCGVYSIDENRDNLLLRTKLWMIYSQYILQYILVILWAYYSFRYDINYVGRNHPWLFVYCLVYLAYSLTTTITFALYCHASKQLYSTWLFVSLILLLFPSTAIMIALFVTEEEHKVAAFDAGFSQSWTRFCVCIDIKSLIVSVLMLPVFCHHCFVLIQTLFAPYLCNKDYLQYESNYYQTAAANADTLQSDEEDGNDLDAQSDIDYNYREKLQDSGDIVVYHANAIHHEKESQVSAQFELS